MTGTEMLSFGPLQIEYQPEVLEPRPWTQRQSEWAARLLDTLPPGDVLELCAGVGHIGLLAVSGTSRHLVQVDADGLACDLARRNAARASQAGARWSVEVRHGDLEEALKPDELFVFVLADPPWVRSDATSDHPDDPVSAIDGGDDGLDLARACLEVISRHLTQDGAALVQVGDRVQVDALGEHLRTRPELGLRAVAHELLEGGAIVHVARLAAGGAG